MYLFAVPGMLRSCDSAMYQMNTANKTSAIIKNYDVNHFKHFINIIHDDYLSIYGSKREYFFRSIMLLIGRQWWLKSGSWKERVFPNYHTVIHIQVAVEVISVCNQRQQEIMSCNYGLWILDLISYWYINRTQHVDLDTTRLFGYWYYCIVQSFHLKCCTQYNNDKWFGTIAQSNKLDLLGSVYISSIEGFIAGCYLSGSFETKMYFWLFVLIYICEILNFLMENLS